jgi:maltooligosyltrehalose trehalohydrolase
MPATPMLFQGQEFSASAPFLYFADFDEDLAAAVRKGRAEFLSQFPSIVDYQKTLGLDDPGSPDTFTRCKLDFAERELHAGAYALHRDLIGLRRGTVAFRDAGQGSLDGAVLSPHAFALRYVTEAPDEARILVVNLGPDLRRSSFAEPLLAPPPDRDWRVEWSSEDARYGGPGRTELHVQGQWCLQAECAIVLAPEARLIDPTATVRRRTA